MLKAAILASAITLSTASPLTSSEFMIGPAPEVYAMAHDFHGILASAEDSHGIEVFERDGKTCKLFTKAFIDRYKRR